MTRPDVDVLDDLHARGLVHDTTDPDAIAARFAAGPLVVYCGFDPTADSLHLGNLIGLLVLRRLADAGHHPIALVGGATGMVGDPSGKSEERNLLDPEALATNVAGIRAQVERIVGGVTEVVDNHTWTAPVGVLEFLRDVGKHVTVNQMVAKESVRTRMEGEDGISYTEFSYMLLQAFDFWHLHETQGCELQVGGSDQWGNITAGIDLVRRRAGAAVHGLTWPLLTRSDGAKFGKTAEGAVWLDADRTSPYQLFQYAMNVPDDDVERFLAQLTLVSVEECRALSSSHAAAPHERAGQRRLATEVVALVHGAEAADAAAEASAVLFGEDATSLGAGALALLAAEVPVHRVARAALDRGYDLVALLAESGVFASKGEARRKLAEGGAYVNNVRVGEGASVSNADVLAGHAVLLRGGKRNYRLVLVD